MSENLRVLDVGCAKSSHLDIYNRPDSSVVGIDLREDFLGNMQVLHPQSQFLRADAHSLPFQPESFDEVYITAVLEHTREPARVLGEAYKALKPGGKLVVDVPHPRYEWIMGKLSQNYHNDGFHQHVFQPDQIKSLVEETGFNVTECSPRMWQAAVGFVTTWLGARLQGNLNYDHDNGELINSNGKSKGKLKDFVHLLSWLSENKEASPKRYYLLSPLRWPNKIFPWVTYIEAIK